MAEEDFQKERRDWWKENYINAVNNSMRYGSINPEQSASEALKQFDEQFKEACDEYRNWKEYKKRIQNHLRKDMKEW